MASRKRAVPDLRDGAEIAHQIIAIHANAIVTDLQRALIRIADDLNVERCLTFEQLRLSTSPS